MYPDYKKKHCFFIKKKKSNTIDFHYYATILQFMILQFITSIGQNYFLTYSLERISLAFGVIKLSKDTILQETFLYQNYFSHNISLLYSRSISNLYSCNNVTAIILLHSDVKRKKKKLQTYVLSDETKAKAEKITSYCIIFNSMRSNSIGRAYFLFLFILICKNQKYFLLR